MHATLFNQGRIIYNLEPLSGLLVKSGKESFDPTRPEMEFIRTHADIGEEIVETPFIPGSGLKGVIRSHAERILRMIRTKKSDCDITSEDRTCIQEKKEKSAYSDHCLACRMFGSTALAARFRFTDVFPWPSEAKNKEKSDMFKRVILEQRPGIKIDRRLGTAAGGAYYEVEIVSAGHFFGEITFRNYQLWQIGLLALVIRDINEGYQRVGAMKSRGLGRVRIKLENFHFDQFGSFSEADGYRLKGVGSNSEWVGKYDLVREDFINLPESLETESRQSEMFMLGQRFKPKNGDVDSAWRNLAEKIIESTHWKNLLKFQG